MGANQDKKQQLDSEIEHIKQNTKIDMRKYIVEESEEDLPGFGEVELYDYDSEIEKSKVIGVDLLNDLVDLYLGDNEEIRNHAYIKSRVREDAEYYSQMKVIQKLSEKLLLQQMRQIDSGDISPRMYEITTKQIGEIRENIKDGRKARLEIEDMYKQMRKDLGLNETIGSDKYTSDEPEESSGDTISNRDLNSKIDDYLKNNKLG